ncbi:MAG TPA: quinone-dependent dihydroorotate dehydrogenase [Polyangiaceae bacterium]
MTKHARSISQHVYALAKPFLFGLDPDTAHAIATFSLGPLEHLGFLRALIRPRRDPRKVTRAMGLEFPTAIGLAGGFDKNAKRARSLAALGFGFLELGTVTARAQDANPRPNMFRLPADRALVNRLGFPNEGAARVAARFAPHKSAVGVPVGFSIGKSRVVEIGEDPAPIVADYTEAFDAVAPVSDFVVVNVSSPNTKNLRALQGTALADTLLGALAKRARDSAKPLLVKIAPDLDDADIDALCGVARAHGLAGVVATNTTVKREGLTTASDVVESIGAGGLSGPPLRARALSCVKRVRAALPDATIIGVGGIETGEDAAAMIDAGANLVQIYTSFVYRGPFAARKIAAELDARRR